MMRPAQIDAWDDNEDADGANHTSELETLPISWKANVESDWSLARQALRNLGTDGRRIALWRQWLSAPSQTTHTRSDEDQELQTTSHADSSTAHPSLIARRNRDSARAVLDAHVCNEFPYNATRLVDLS